MVQPFITENLAAIADLCRKHHVQRLEIFGSAVRDDFDEASSDVDLIVVFDVPEGVRFGHNWFTLQAELQDLLGRQVDLIPEGSIRNPYILGNVDKQKEQLYAA